LKSLPSELTQLKRLKTLRLSKDLKGDPMLADLKRVLPRLKVKF
jgi:hypothetical protein